MIRISRNNSVRERRPHYLGVMTPETDVGKRHKETMGKGGKFQCGKLARQWNLCYNKCEIRAEFSTGPGIYLPFASFHQEGESIFPMSEAEFPACLGGPEGYTAGFLSRFPPVRGSKRSVWEDILFPPAAGGIPRFPREVFPHGVLLRSV